MAHDTQEYAAAEGNDYAEHERTYEFFLKFLKWNIIIAVIVLALMAYFLV